MTSSSITSQSEIPPLIADLGNENGLVRQRARLHLVHIGRAGIPLLLEALKSPSVRIRWETVKVLGDLRVAETAAPLTDMLLDDNTGIRWSAMEGLIHLGRTSLRPLLELFTKNFNSPIVREGLHHILHIFKDRHMLNKQETILFEKLNRMGVSGFQTSWNSEAAWAAEKALEVLIYESREGNKK